MAEVTPAQYRRLPGNGFYKLAPGRRYSITLGRLWLGDDHLLAVELNFGSENYKRFYFRDIQAIYLYKTNAWLAGNLAWGTLAGICFLWAVIQGISSGAIALGIIGGISVIFLTLNALRGPTCTCRLKTAVHWEDIPSLRRLRNAEKVLARVMPLIEVVQGPASAEALTPPYTALLANAGAAPAVAGQVLRILDPSLSAYGSRAHQVLFSALLADALADVLNIFLPSIPVVLLNMLTGTVLTGAVLVALVRQHGTDLKPAVKVVTWISAAFTAAGCLAGYIVMIVMAPGSNLEGTQWGYIKSIADLRPFETTWWLALLSVTAALAGALGGAGLLLLRQHWREKKVLS